jgi:hypothetical protein
MADPYDELTELELMQRGVPRITVRPLGVEAPPPNDMAWGRPAAEGGRPRGAAVRAGPDAGPNSRHFLRWARSLPPATYDPTFRERYTTTTVQEPGQPDAAGVRAAGRAGSTASATSALDWQVSLFGGARAVEPPQAVGSRPPPARFGSTCATITVRQALDYGAAPARMIADGYAAGRRAFHPATAIPT